MARRIPRNAARDAMAGGITLILAAAYWFEADAIRASPLAGNGVGASAVPKGLAVALACFSIGLILQSAWAWRNAPDDGASAAADPARRAAVRRHLRALGMLLIGVVFLAIMNYLGYWLSLVLLFAVTAYYNGRAVSKGLILFAVVLSVAYYLLFVQFLGIPLPSGVWSSLWAGAANWLT
jgi:hypothetical protein